MSTGIRNKLSEISESVDETPLQRVLSPPEVLLLPHLVMVVLVFGGAMLVTVLIAFQPESVGQGTISWTQWTVDNVVNVATDTFWFEISKDTVWFSALTTVVCFLVSYPAAYALAMKIGRGKLIFIIALILPLVTSINIRMFGWVILLIQDGILSSVVTATGVVQTMPQLMYKELTVLLGTIYAYLPFMLFPIYISFANLDDELIEAARDQGADRLQIFRRIVLPLTKPGIMIGALFTFVLSLGAEVESLMLGGSQVVTMSMDITYSFQEAQNWQVGSAKVLGMLIISAIAGILILRTVDLEEIAERR